MMSNPAIHAPPWSSSFDDPTATLGYHLPVSGVSGSGAAADFLLSDAALAALQRYLPCNDACPDDDDVVSDGSDTPVDAYASDEFRMYDFKVRRCARGRSHDWTECPFAHPGEKARRRDPRKFHYSGTACPDFRKGSCKRGDACEFAHGVFECWLHPARYRTQPCKDGTACRRRVCFFAHTPEQLRVLPQQFCPKAAAAAAALESYDGSPLRQQAALESYLASKSYHQISSSPTSTVLSPPMSPPLESPPVSPVTPRRRSWPVGSPVNDIVASLRQLQLNKAKSSPRSWAFQLHGSPRAEALVSPAAYSKAGFCSLPATPTRAMAAACGGGLNWIDGMEERELVEERVESGRALRAKMFEKLSKDGLAGNPAAASAPDIGWVSELVKFK